MVGHCEEECLHAARLIRRRKHKKVKVVSDVCASFSIICAVPRKELLSALTVSRHQSDHFDAAEHILYLL